MADPKLRIRLPGGGNAQLAINVAAGQKANVGQYYNDILPAKDWCITDDVTRVADSACFTVSNVDGENSGKFTWGRLVEIDASDDAVAGGQWTRVFTGRVMRARHVSGANGGTINVEAYDLGWHLTGCCARPLQSTNGIQLGQLVQRLIDPTWGFAPTVTVGNVLNRTLKQGRQGVIRAQPHNPEQILPYIQVEPGQTPWGILEEYFKREGFLLNVGAQGDLIIFQPDYFQVPLYDSIEFHKSSEGSRKRNNVVGDVSFEQSLEGIYSEFQCWSTIAVPNEAQQVAITQNPNAQYVHQSYKPSQNPLPFYRLQVVVDSEAINTTMQKNRAIWGYQSGAFSSWVYEVTVRGHSSRPAGQSVGAFWTSDTMVSVNDTVHGVVETLYVQSVQRSMSAEGARTKLTLRKPLLDPTLQAQVGGGAKKSLPPPVK